MDKTAAKQTWNILAKAIDEIYNRNASQLSFEELYRNAYNLVLHKHGTLLYEGVTEKINSHLTKTAERLSNVPSNSLLEELVTTWTEHQVRTVVSSDLRCDLIYRRVPYFAVFFHFLVRPLNKY
jgi:cullin 3